jgi:hypothetical protein
MGGIDLKNQLLQMFLAERKHMHKWYMKLFRRILNARVLNAMIIYRYNAMKQITQLPFRVSFVEVLFQQTTIQSTRSPGGNCRNDIASTKFSFLGRNQHSRGGVWYTPSTDRGAIQSFAIYSVMSGCVWRNVLKPITQKLISTRIKSF